MILAAVDHEDDAAQNITLATKAMDDAGKPIAPIYPEAWQEALPRAELVRFAQCGHMVPYEKPAEFVSAVTAFLG